MESGERNRILLVKLQCRYGAYNVVVYQRAKIIYVLMAGLYSVEAVKFIEDAYQLESEADEELIVRFNQPLQFGLMP